MPDDIDLTPPAFLRRYPSQEAWRDRLAPCTTTGAADFQGPWQGPPWPVMMCGDREATPDDFSAEAWAARLAEPEQAAYHERVRAAVPRTKLTEAGEQYVIPGAERKAPKGDAPYQPNLFD